MNFEQMNLPENMLQALKNIHYKTPTPIQAQAIPLALEGRDILGSAQTGTGKTAAFAIPLINALLKDEKASALVLLPTRELAGQVLEMTNKILGKKTDILSALLIGGDSIEKQLTQLKRRPRIIVGTPGRINDHLKRRSLTLTNTGFLVLDETDRMLDMGFGVQLEQIAKFLPAERQTLMFSATLPKNIVTLSKKYLQNPVRIAVGEDGDVAPKIKQELIKTTEETKYGDLMGQLQSREGSILIFVKTKHGAEKLSKKLTKENQSADAIHGNLRQAKRDRVISDFRKQKSRILVATDIAARGLDIPHIQHVINYDLPQCPEDYIHRIGRTARAGAEGFAVNLLTPKDGQKWKEIYKLITPAAKTGTVVFNGDTLVKEKDPAGHLRAKPKQKSKSRFKSFDADKKKSTKSKFNKNSKKFDAGTKRTGKRSKKRI